jgi:hypothetical protein
MLIFTESGAFSNFARFHIKVVQTVRKVQTLLPKKCCKELCGRKDRAITHTIHLKGPKIPRTIA